MSNGSRHADGSSSVGKKMLLVGFICLVLLLTVTLSSIYPTLLSGDSNSTKATTCGSCEAALNNLVVPANVENSLELVTSFLKNSTDGRNVECRIGWKFKLKNNHEGKFYCVT